MHAKTEDFNTDLMHQEWHIADGGSSYYPLAVKAGEKDVLRFHTWDAASQDKAQAIVTLQNNLRPGMEFSLDENALHAALDTFPTGQWSVRESKMQYPAAVMPEEGMTPVFIMDFSTKANEIARYLVDLRARAANHFEMQAKNPAARSPL